MDPKEGPASNWAFLMNPTKETHMNILLVDDDRFIIKALQETIHWEALGIEQVYTASSLSQAQAIIQSHPIALMIQWYRDATRQWARSPSLGPVRKYDIQTIFLTNYADFNYAQKAIELQSFEYYLKPIDPDRLEFIIQKALNKIKAPQECGPISTTRTKEAEFWHDYLENHVHLKQNSSFKKWQNGVIAPNHMKTTS